MKNIKIFYLTLTLFCSLFFSCKHEPMLIPNALSVCPDEVEGIIKNHCGTCHNSTSGELKSINSLADISKHDMVVPYKPLQSKLYKIMTQSPLLGNHMPPKGSLQLTSQELDLIEVWILQGASITPCCAPNTIPDTNTTYSGVVWPIIQANCSNQCHDNFNPPPKLNDTLDFSSQDKFLGWLKKSNHLQRFIAAIDSTGPYPMPKTSPYKPLSKCDKFQIKNWIYNKNMNND